MPTTFHFFHLEPQQLLCNDVVVKHPTQARICHFVNFLFAFWPTVVCSQFFVPLFLIHLIGIWMYDDLHAFSLTRSSMMSTFWVFCLSLKWNKSSAVAEMGDRLATIDMGRKVCVRWDPASSHGKGLPTERGTAAPFRRRELGSHLTQCHRGWGLPLYQVASWSIQPFHLATIHQCYRETGQTDNGPMA